MFWSGSGAFIRRHLETGDAHYISWQVSFASRRHISGSRRLDVLHLSCSRQPLGPTGEREPRAGEFEIRLAARDGAGAGGSTASLLCLRISARAFDLWIAAAGPRSGRGARRRIALPAARPAIDADILDAVPLLLDGGTIVLDGSGEADRG